MIRTVLIIFLLFIFYFLHLLSFDITCLWWKKLIENLWHNFLPNWVIFIPCGFSRAQVKSACSTTGWYNLHPQTCLSDISLMAKNAFVRIVRAKCFWTSTMSLSQCHCFRQVWRCKLCSVGEHTNLTAHWGRATAYQNKSIWWKVVPQSSDQLLLFKWDQKGGFFVCVCFVFIHKNRCSHSYRIIDTLPVVLVREGSSVTIGPPSIVSCVSEPVLSLSLLLMQKPSVA